MNRVYPKVIIVGETFRKNGGGGITMTNLFKDWPKENIGVITSQIDETDPTTGYRYYQLGTLEIKFPFPFCLIQKKVSSGEYVFDNETLQQGSTTGPDLLQNFKAVLRNSLNFILVRLGLSYRFYSIDVSNTLITWIHEFDPDVIYIQPFLHKTMRFGNLLYERLKIRYVIHIMDDSVKYVNKSIILKKSNQRKIDRDFEQLVYNADKCMCISDAMAEEYWHRYHKLFVPFRNPVELERWLPYWKRAQEVDPGKLKIIYTGRLFPPAFQSLIMMCQVVDKLNRKGRKVELHIYTYDANQCFVKRAKRMLGVNILTPVIFDEIPRLIPEYDIFFLCLDFDKKAQLYSQYSISTRTSEGMISGVPVMVYAPGNSAMYKYFKKHEAGLVLCEHDTAKIEDSIVRLWKDNNLRIQLSLNATNQVLRDSNAVEVREKFRKYLSDL